MSKSEVWNHVRILDENYVLCKHCPQQLKNCKNTTNYWTHLKQHNIFSKKSKEKVKENDENSESSSTKVNKSKNSKYWKRKDYFCINSVIIFIVIISFFFISNYWFWSIPSFKIYSNDRFNRSKVTEFTKLTKRNLKSTKLSPFLNFV